MTEELKPENTTPAEPMQAEIPNITEGTTEEAQKQIQAIEVPDGAAVICLMLLANGTVQLHQHGSFPKVTALGALELAKNAVLQGA